MTKKRRAVGFAVLLGLSAGLFPASAEERSGAAALPEKVAVLTVHGVPGLIHPRVNTPPERFKSYMRFLKDNHYTVIALRDVSRCVDGRRARETLAPAWERRFKK